MGDVILKKLKEETEEAQFIREKPSKISEKNIQKQKKTAKITLILIKIYKIL